MNEPNSWHSFCATFRKLCLYGVALLSVQTHAADVIHEPIRAKIPRAEVAPIVDGSLDEYGRGFCTPVEYFHSDAKNRAAQLFYLWDDHAIYLGVRTLDEHPFSPHDLFWTGDAIEWYFDTRQSPDQQRLGWGPGAVHCFLSALTLHALEPRFCLRPGQEDAIPQDGIQLAGRRLEHGLEYEFCLPWRNFDGFHPHVGAELHLDAELSYSDGVARSYRSFAFGNPLSVECPANLARVQLIDKFSRDDWQPCGPVMMPIRVDVDWTQSGVPLAHAAIAIPPNLLQEIGRVEFRLLDLEGKEIAVLEAVDAPLGVDPTFVRRTATWPASSTPPGSFHIYAVVYDKGSKELARIAPRLVSVNMEPGY